MSHNSEQTDSLFNRFDVVTAWFEWAQQHEDPAEFDPSDPYSIMDGKWGGFGPTCWRLGSDLHSSLPPNNVYELTRAPVDHFTLEFFVRCWDVGSQAWRHLRFEELQVLPFSWDKTVPVTFTKVTIPAFKKDVSQLRSLDLRAVIIGNSLRE